MTKMKGLFKGLKNISNIFVYKEHEMQIGNPTDVRHVAHIGWDGSSSNSPSWMSQFKTSSDFSSASLSNLGRETSWDSQDFEQPRAQKQASNVNEEPPCPDVPKVPKKVKRKKPKSASSQSSSRTSKSRASLGIGMEIQEGFQDQIRVN